MLRNLRKNTLKMHQNKVKIGEGGQYSSQYSQDPAVTIDLPSVVKV